MSRKQSPATLTEATIIKRTLQGLTASTRAWVPFVRQVQGGGGAGPAQVFCFLFLTSRTGFNSSSEYALLDIRSEQLWEYRWNAAFGVHVRSAYLAFRCDWKRYSEKEGIKTICYFTRIDTTCLLSISETPVAQRSPLFKVPIAIVRGQNK